MLQRWQNYRWGPWHLAAKGTPSAAHPTPPVQISQTQMMRVTPSYCHFTLLNSLPCKQRGFSESFPWKRRCIETSCVESPDINNQLANITTKVSANYTFRPRKPTSNRYPNLENQDAHNICSVSTACPCASCWKSLDAVRGNGNSQLASSGGRCSFQCLEPSNCNMKTCGISVSKWKIKLWQLDNHRIMMM